MMMKSRPYFIILFFIFLISHHKVKAEKRNRTANDLNTINRKSTLKLVHALFRHGARTPVNTYPNDPYLNDTFYPYGWGQLTNDGKRDLFQIGKNLGRRYQNFVKPYYNPDSLHAQSTASSRTLMSMATVLAGMFPPKNTPMEWNTKFNWQPIPIFSDPLDKDIKLRMTAACPAYDELRKQAELQNPPKPENLYQELSEMTGLAHTSSEDVLSTYITLWAEQLYGLKLPEWTSNYYPDKMLYMAEQGYINNAYNTEMQRIKAGPLLQDMLEQVQSKANGTLKPENRKLFMYCAHDWTIANVLSGLKVWERQLPDFSALVLFEWHQDPSTNEYYMELYFQNGPKKQLQPLTLPGCTFQCPLSSVLKLTQDVMPIGSYEEMCSTNK